MKTLEKKSDKVKKICDSIRRETLDPAKKEAEQIIADAERRAQQIIEEAEGQAKRLQATIRAELDQEKNVFNSSLVQSAKLSLETLRQAIEKDLFNPELEFLLNSETQKPDVLAALLKAIIAAVEKEGVEADIEAVIPQVVKAREVNTILGDQLIKKLKGNSVALGKFNGGVQVKLLDKKMTIDVTADTLKAMIASFVREDFRKMIFAVEK